MILISDKCSVVWAVGFTGATMHSKKEQLSNCQISNNIYVNYLYIAFTKIGKPIVITIISTSNKYKHFIYAFILLSWYVTEYKKKECKFKT